MPDYPIPDRYKRLKFLPLRGKLQLLDTDPPRYLWDGDVEIEVNWEAGIISLEGDPPPKFLAQIQQMSQRTPKEQEWRRVLETAQGAVGKSLDKITPPERGALVDLLLMRAKAVGADGTLKPLRDWLGFEPADFDE